MTLNLTPHERTSLFIDGASLFHSSKALGFDVDFRKLLTLFSKESHFVRAYYYAALLDTEEYSPLKPLTDWLSYNGYAVVVKFAKDFIDDSGKRRIKSSMEVELTVDMMEQAENIDHAIIFSGDNNLRRAVESVQRKGTRVTAISTMRSSSNMIGDDLRRQVDTFIDLADISQDIQREKIQRTNI